MNLFEFKRLIIHDKSLAEKILALPNNSGSKFLAKYAPRQFAAIDPKKLAHIRPMWMCKHHPQWMYDNYKSYMMIYNIGWVRDQVPDGNIELRKYNALEISLLLPNADLIPELIAVPEIEIPKICRKNDDTRKVDPSDYDWEA